MNGATLSYIKLDSPIHRLTGATKLIFFFFWSIAAMITYDTRVLLLLLLSGVIAFKLSKINFKQVAFVVYFILFFLAINNIAIYIFSPMQGVEVYGSKHELLKIIGPYSITMEQLFYQFNITVKYFTVIPMALLFILTTDPSEFASSLNRIGVSYKISYAVSIALRYIPDIQRDFQNISFAQQARGLDLSRKERLFKRIKNISAILIPLILSSLERIETISTAMELRRFGQKKNRTWYHARPFQMLDYVAIIVVCIVLFLSIWSTYTNGNRFYNPFR